MNIWLFAFIIFLGSVSMCLSIVYRRKRGIGILAALFFTVYVRGSQHLNTHIHPWHDGYYYFSIVEAALSTGKLQPTPAIESWYPTVNSQVPWSGLQAYSTILGVVTGVTEVSALRSLAPILIGAVLFAVLVYFYHPLLGRDWSILAAFWTSMQGVFIHYQTEFHTQSLAFIAFVIFFGGMIQYALYSDRRDLVISLFGVVLIGISHHFSAIITPVIAVIFIFGLLVQDFVPGVRTDFPTEFGERIVKLTLLCAVVAASIHAQFPHAKLDEFVFRPIMLLLGAPLPAPPTPPATGGEDTIVDSFSLFAKGIVLLLALPTIYDWFRDRTGSLEKRYITCLVVLTGAVLVTLLFVAVVNITALIRMLALLYIPTVPLAIMSIREYRSSIPLSQPNTDFLMGVGFSLVILLGVFAGVIPSLIDHSADINNDGYQEVKPIGEQGIVGGEWVRGNVQGEYSEYYVTFRSRMVGNYYGKIPLSELEYYSPGSEGGITIFDTSHDENIQEEIMNVYYSNGRIVVAEER